MPLTIHECDSSFPISQDSAALTTLHDVRNLFRAMGSACRKKVQGRDDVIATLLTALFADGHVLLEDHPGSGKTTLAKAMGALIQPHAEASCKAFRRIQFTPDLLPSDVTGVTMFDPETKLFSFRQGPVFANIVLADEINRTSPKVQSSMLEAMAEKQVTVDNTTYRLDELFFVLATQNPLDLAGTYPLPKAQLDRFLFKIEMKPLSRDAELNVLLNRSSSSETISEFKVTVEDILLARSLIQQKVIVSPVICECLTKLAETIRNDSRVAQGVSTRSLVIAIPALQVWAMLHGRDHVTPADIKALSVLLFAHRIELRPGVQDVTGVVTDLTASVVEEFTRAALKR